MKGIAKDFLKYSKKHQKYREENCLNMIASENIKSEAVLEVKKRFYDFDFRYAEGANKINGDPKERYYQGQKFSREMEKLTSSAFRKLFDVNFVEPRPISGSTANQATFRGLSNYNGNKMMSMPLSTGGHITHDYAGLAGKVLNLEISNLVFNSDEFNIDIDESKKKIREEEPSIIVLGASLFPFSHPVKEISSVAKEVDAFVVYDAAHVLGLISGGKFQDPIGEGADFVSSSTHKTFPGGQRGVIYGDISNGRLEEAARYIQNATFPFSLSNHHLLSMAENIVAILEMCFYGEDYAEQTIENAKKLAESLYENDIFVIGEDKGFTESHQIVIDVEDYGRGNKVATKLEESNIIVNKNILPWDDQSNKLDPSGLRVGVQELTRNGFKEEDMEQFAGYISSVIKGEERPKNIRPKVLKKVKDKKLEYGFKSLQEMESKIDDFFEI